MHGKDLEQCWEEVDAEEHLCRPVDAPVDKLQQRHQSVRLVHVVSVLPCRAENADHPDHRREQFAELLQVPFFAGRDSFAHLDQQRHEFKFAHQL